MIKDRERDDHKYIARVEIKRSTSKKEKNYRYFYDKAEYQAYLDGLKEEPSDKGKGDNIASVVSDAITNVKNTAENIIQDFKDITRRGKQAIDTSLNVKGSDKANHIGSEDAETTSTGAYVVESILRGLFGKSMDYTWTKMVNEEVTKDNETYSVDDFSELAKKDEETTDEQDQAAVNPNYLSTAFDYAYTNNCSYCTAAYELRQRGYDVEAQGIPLSEFVDYNEIASWYENPDVYVADINSPLMAKRQAEKIEETLLQEGEGARGQFILYWTEGGGHSVVWEVENNDVILRDCQNNTTIDLIDYMQYSETVAFFRTDNLELNEDILKGIRNKKK